MTRCALLAVILATFAARATAETVFYVADHEVKKVIKIKEDGTLLWDYPNDNAHDVQVLPNKNILLNRAKGVQEVTPDKKVVWEYRSAGSPEAVQRLANGNTLIADNARMTVLELDAAGKTVWEYKVANDNKRPTPTMRMVRRLDNGNTLTCASTEDAVLEIDRSGKIVWKYALPFPYLPTRQPGRPLRHRGRPGRQDGVEIRRRRRPGRPTAELAQRPRALEEQQHAHRRRARRRHPRGVAGQENRADHPQPGDETSSDDRGRRGIADIPV